MYLRLGQQTESSFVVWWNGRWNRTLKLKGRSTEKIVIRIRVGAIIQIKETEEAVLSERTRGARSRRGAATRR